MKTRMIVFSLGLVIQLAACGEDTPAAKEDQGAPTVDKGNPVIDMAVKIDQGAPDSNQPRPDLGAPDKPVTQPDLTMPQPLTNSHEGWQTAGCTGASCHSLPITAGSHVDTTAIADCAGCHGGNGACNPNGPTSGNKNHNSGSSCTMCHQSEHGAGYNNTACKACHYAPAGVVDCP